MLNKIIICAIFLAGCSTVDPNVLSGKNPIIIDKEILTDCGVLSTLKYPASFEDILQIYSSNLQMYVDCKNQNNSKKQLLEKIVAGEVKK